MRRTNQSHRNRKFPVAPVGARHPRKVQREWAEVFRFRPIIGAGAGGDFGPRREVGFYVVVERLITDYRNRRERHSPVMA